MKGDPKVIERLNGALSLELGAVNQYWLHYRLADDWGYGKLAKKEKAESLEEMQHADRLIERIIFLEGTAAMQPGQIQIGKNVREILEADLAGENEAREYYRASREICRDQSDYVSMELFESLLADEEGHINFLEGQLNVLNDIGEQLYGQLQAEPSSEAD